MLLCSDLCDTHALLLVDMNSSAELSARDRVLGDKARAEKWPFSVISYQLFIANSY